MISYELVHDPERLGSIANEINDAHVIGLDIEATGLSPLHNRMRLVQVNTCRGVYVVDLWKTKTLGPVVDALRDSKCIKIIHNAKFEQKWFLHEYGVELWPVFDPFRASAIIHNGKNLGHNLYDLYHRELKVAQEVDDQGHTRWDGPLTKEQLTYAAEDVTYLPQLREVLRPKLAKTGLNRIALLEFGACLPEAEIELNGFAVDQERWLQLAKANRKQLDVLRAQLDQMMPSPKGQLGLPGMSPGFNYDSPLQVKASFARLGIKLQDTRAETMAMVAAKHPAVRQFMEYRKIAKRLSSFGPDWLRHIDLKTGRIHTDFWPLTGAGRYASSNPNLQQIPRAFEYRDCFRAPPGYIILVCDFGQIELRIAAEISRDRVLREIYLRGEDAHRRTASIISGVPLDRVTKEQRQGAKPVNFGLIYGLGAERLVIYSLAEYGVAITLGEAKKFRSRFFEGYSGIRSWHDQALRDGERTHMAKTLWGRRRYLDPQKDRNKLLNTPVQGCYPASMRVLTSDKGYQPIGELTAGTVWTGTRWARFECVAKGVWVRARLHLSNGQLHDCDTRHEVLVARDDGYEFVHYEKLVAGDRICMSLAQAQEFGTGSAVPPEEFYWLGFAIGNGSSEKSANWLSLSIGDRKGRYEHRTKAEEAVSFFRLMWKPRCRDEPQDKVMSTVVVEAKAFRARWERLGFPWGCDAHEKVVPARVWSVPLEHRRRFLVGLLDADGTVGDAGKTTPSLHMCNEALLRDIQILARTVGVESKLRGPLHPGGESVSWRLDFNGGQLASLGYGDRKRTNVQMPAPPFLVAAFLEAVARKGAKLRGSAATLISRLRQGGTTSIYTIARLCDEACLVLSVPLYAYATLCSKKPLGFSEETYTLRVYDSGHRFDAEGVIAKNTGADGLKRALREVYFRLKPYGRDNARMVHMVHDEIVLEVKDDPHVIEAVKAEIEQGMVDGIQPMLPHIPVVAEADTGPSWAAH